jgi:hypothetical protein
VHAQAPQAFTKILVAHGTAYGFSRPSRTPAAL